jgi:hypothetical protein
MEENAAKKKILLSTTVYEKNFRETLDPNHWFFNFKSSMIDQKMIVVNNINHDSRVELENIKKNLDPSVIYVESAEIGKSSLDFYGCDLKEGEKGYWYSIQYFCQLYYSVKNNFDYLFNVSSDCHPQQIDIDDFINDSISILNDEEKVVLTTIPWIPNGMKEVGEHEQNHHNIALRSDLFYFTKIVSDQIFLLDPRKIIGFDFNIKENLHPFPGYGGDCFEKRFCNYLIRNNFLRAIYKNHYYIHNSY